MNNDHILWIIVPIAIFTYLVEFYVAYLWAIKSFDLKWWLWEGFWLGILFCYSTSVYMAYNSIGSNKNQLIVSFSTSLLLIMLWAIGFYFGWGRFIRFCISMLAVYVSGYQYVITQNEEHLVTSKILLGIYMGFVFIGGVAFGIKDIGIDNVKNRL